LILKQKAARWNGDGEIRGILEELTASVPGTPTVGRFSAQGSQKLLAHGFDRAAIARKKLPYERLDQITVDILTGVR